LHHEVGLIKAEKAALADTIPDSLSEDVLDLCKESSSYYSPRLKHHAKVLLVLSGKSEDLTTYLNAFLNGRITPSAFVEMVDDLGYSTLAF
jgi:hypothetical protein